ncbi:MAG: lytic transglycosylase domain-containing protein [Firmicutes bacterium]|nr:lytic transglycosylase domain-containing protein [Bacillota bacterium]
MRATRPNARWFFLSTLLLAAVFHAATFGQGRATPAPEEELTRLARQLQETGSEQAYRELAAFAQSQSDSVVAARAALVLGRHDQQRKRYRAARAWLARASTDPLLREYALYWDALALRGTAQPAAALEQLTRIRREFPESVLSEAVVRELVELALEIGRPLRALEELEAYGEVERNPALLLLRARALERAGRPEAAALHYNRLYYEFSESPEAEQAAAHRRTLAQMLGRKFPAASREQQLARAESQYRRRRWRPALAEFRALLPRLEGHAAQRARLRIAQCRARLEANAAALARLQLTDPELDAERLFALVQRYRQLRQPDAMVRVTEQAAEKYPNSPWTEEALFGAGNWFWVELNRSRAAEFYRRVVELFPRGRHAPTAHWRLAWTAYLERRPEAVSLLETHLARFRGSPYTENALYWLGRLAEQSGELPRARAFYAALLDAYPHTYFGLQARQRQRELGAEPRGAVPVLALLPAPPERPTLDEPVPPEGKERWERAQALRRIALGELAERELRAAHATTGAPRLLLEAARAALEAGRFWTGISLARQAYPELERWSLAAVPEEIWRTIYPVAFPEQIDRYASRYELDPILVCGVIRQESLFQPDAVSQAGAVGLMQILPRTGSQIARRQRLSYSRRRLFDPEYNLRLGTAHLAELVQEFGRLELALAAYNAGRSRVLTWQGEREFAEPAEFVESIPITETREYVQIVLRNAEIYRQLQGGSERP